jgi:hypothetical protein
VNPWIRKNGDFSLTVSSGFDRDGTPYGIPYGSCPRLVVAYIITQDHQLAEKWLRNHGKVPSLGGETRGFYLILGPRELSLAYRYCCGEVCPVLAEACRCVPARTILP